MAPKSSVQLLQRFKVLYGVLSSVLAVLSATLIRARLIPYQLSVLGTIGALFILVGLLITLAYQSQLKKYLASFIVTSCVTLVLLTLLQIFFVVAVENYGDPPRTHYFLVGYELTEQGKSWMKDIGSGRPETTIGNVGYKRIPIMYGTSYLIIQAIYSFNYLIFVLAVVLALGGILMLGGNTGRLSRR